MGRLVHLDDVPEKRTPAGRWRQLNGPLGIKAFGVNVVAMDPDEEFDIEHDESDDGHQEMYIVLSGRMRFRLGHEEVEAGPGDIVCGPGPGGDAQLLGGGARHPDRLRRRGGGEGAPVRRVDRPRTGVLIG